MTKKATVLLASVLLFSAGIATAQVKYKFGDVKPADFAPAVYPLDSSAAAIVLADIGSSEFQGNNKSGFSLLFRHFRRARILNKNGYDIANVEIPLYTSGSSEEQLDNLKAVTYNLENGKVVETKLDVKGALFKDVISRNKVIRKFTFPNIKAGSIIEYEYRVVSDFLFNLQPWNFQGDYPCLWSEYTVSQPQFYSYVTLTQGYIPYFIKEQKTRRENFSIAETRGTGASERASFVADVTDFHWAMKDIPALREEGFTSTLRNHISRIEFQLKAVGEPYEYRNFMGTWTDMTKDLLNDEDFGLALGKENGWLKDYMAEATGGATDSLAKARNIYAWLRDRMTCTSYNSRYLENPLKDVIRTRNGNEAEINLLLTAMLLRAGLRADPVMLGTRAHGYTSAIYPLIDRFNYVICRLVDNNKVYYLDASRPELGFGRLSPQCYNGHARVIDKEATPISLDADSLRETTMTSVFVINDEKGNTVGSFNQEAGYYSSLDIREAVKKEGRDAFFAKLKKNFGSEIKLSNPSVDSLQKPDVNVKFSFDFDVQEERGDLLYFNPLLSEAYKENPFKSAQRLYPVEMPYCLDDTYNLQMEVPQGYEVDELPQQAIVKMNEEGDGFFEYRISRSGNSITFRSRLVINRTYYAPEEYDMLRDFFGFVVKKQNEQVVFKKKK